MTMSITRHGISVLLALGRHTHSPKMYRQTTNSSIVNHYFLPSVAYVGGVSDEECLTSDEKACKDYNQKLVELAKLVEETAPKIESIKSLADEIAAIKIAQPEIVGGEDSPMLKAALEAAKKATAEHGPKSKEAMLAWEEVEELAASGSQNAMGASLIDECLVEQLEACQGLEELQRVLSLVKEQDRYGG